VRGGRFLLRHCCTRWATRDYTRDPFIANEWKELSTAEQEREAYWLAGAVLISDEAAIEIVRQKLTGSAAASSGALPARGLIDRRARGAKNGRRV
jgi:hypothetical protein